MSYELRDSKNYFFGILDNPAAISDTTLSSAQFAALGTGYSAANGGTYIPLVLHDPSVGAYEIVWVVGHSSGGTTVTVVRGREGTAAQAWNAGTQVTIAPTAGRDVLAVALSNGLPPDAHYGMRVARTDKGDVIERTKTGWGPSVGAGIAADQHKNMSQLAVPDGAALLLRAGSTPSTFTTASDGNFNVTYKTPFPNGTLAISCTSTAYAANGAFVCYQQRADGCSMTALNGTGGRLASTVISVQYIAFGW
jgi:hypothetical protein